MGDLCGITMGTKKTTIVRNMPRTNVSILEKAKKEETNNSIDYIHEYTMIWCYCELVYLCIHVCVGTPPARRDAGPGVTGKPCCSNALRKYSRGQQNLKSRVTTVQVFRQPASKFSCKMIGTENLPSCLLGQRQVK